MMVIEDKFYTRLTSFSFSSADTIKQCKILKNKANNNLLSQCTDQPMDSDDRISVHSCCKLSNEKHGEVDIACMYHSI